MQQHDFMFLLRMVLVGKYDQHYALYCGYGRWKITLSTWDFLWMIHDGVMPSGSLLNSILDTTTQLAMISSYSLKTQDTFMFEKLSFWNIIITIKSRQNITLNAYHLNHERSNLYFMNNLRQRLSSTKQLWKIVNYTFALNYFSFDSSFLCMGKLMWKYK